MCLDPVAQRLISPNSVLKFNLGFIFLFFKSTFSYNFLYYRVFLEHPLPYFSHIAVCRR